MKRKLGSLETQFFAYAQMRRLRVVRAGELVASVLRLKPVQAFKVLISSSSLSAMVCASAWVGGLDTAQTRCPLNVRILL
jgi:hypothetical protein